MVRITVEGETREYEESACLMDVAAEFQPQFPYDILLAFVDGKLQELHKRIKPDSVVHFLTGKDRPGIQSYRRSAVFVMLKALFEVIGRDRVEKVCVDFSIGDGLFVEAKGDFLLNQETVEKIKAKMWEYVDARLPIMKRSVNTDEAVELFHRHGMYDKEQLFRYRRSSRVNIYSLGGFEDYFYGYMLQNTGYIRYFDLIPYEYGFVLMLPTSMEPTVVPELRSRPKLFQVLRETGEWGEKLGVSNVGGLNEQIARGRINELMLIQEALQEKKIGEAAEAIAASPDKKLVMIAGPSSSGKTTFAHRLSIQLRAKGLIPHPISVDDYFVNRVDSPRDENGNYNYEALECLDLQQFQQDMADLLAGKTVQLPRYNFITGEREYRGDYLTLGPEDILVIEGIHCLNDKMSGNLPAEAKFKIYISALTQLNIDEHNRVPTTDGRLIRRMVRDARTRGASAQKTIRMWPSVRKGEEENIFPYQESADVMFNSALVYELAVLKQYAEPLLFGIPRDCEEYLEAKRLLKFLDYFLGVGSENIPKNSILREFIGGSCFQV